MLCARRVMSACSRAGLQVTDGADPSCLSCEEFRVAAEQVERLQVEGLMVLGLTVWGLVQLQV